MFIRVLTVTVLLGLSLHTPARADFQGAAAAYNRGDYEAAFVEFKRVAETGNATAQFALGIMYENGEAVTRDVREAVRWYRKAALGGNALAQSKLGEAYREGRGVAQDNTAAAHWYRKAAEQGDVTAQFYLGFMYLNGQGLPQNAAEALKWFHRAAEQGNVAAQFNVGLIYDKGRGVPRNAAEAAKWYRRAAEQGAAEAQNNLGSIYAEGQGVSQNALEALKWYRRAAEQGYAAAQTNLGLMYGRGEGVSQNYVEAAKWHRRAAEQGFARAQYELAQMYDEGQGVAQEKVEAAKWFRRAAEQGHVAAQNNLGVMYAEGQGVLQNHVEAHKWFNLAAAQGNSGARRNRDHAARLMTQEQIAEAQRLARAWRSQQQTATTKPGSSPAIPRSLETETYEERVLKRLRELGRIASLQRRLVSLGYGPGPADGILGKRTRAAIRAFQKSNGLPVTGMVSEKLEAALLSARRTMTEASPAVPRALKVASTGSGFFVSLQGDLLTNDHVVRGCREIRIPPSVLASVVAQDKTSDLALLKISTGKTKTAVKFREGRGIRPGDAVVVLGYPLRGLLASEVNVSSGTVSALAGLRDDRRFFQITAPVQSGNSGGPVLDTAGNAVGVVVGKLNAIRIAKVTGNIPQNVNFAISAGTARAFLDAWGVPYETAPSTDSLGTAEVAAKARISTVVIECWK